MPEHVHLLMRPAKGETVAGILMALKRRFAARALQRWRELDARVLPQLRDARGHYHFWQAGGGYDRNINGDHERDEKLSYLHENLVVRGLVRAATNWKWSSARWHLDQARYIGPVIDPLPL